MLKTLLFLALVSVVLAKPNPQQFEDGEYSNEAKYSFEFDVDDSDESLEFGHEESRDGDYTEGYYYVRLPNGVLQKVKYYVDGDSGFVANVSYEGEPENDGGYQ